MLDHDELLRRIERHLQESGETPTAFGRRVAKDGNLIPDLRAGRSPTMRLAARIIDAMASQPAAP
jgi:hypothetical protein